MKNIMKSIAPALLIVIMGCSEVLGQDKYFTREGHITFQSNAEDEDIEAHNYKVTCVLDAATGNMEFAVLMKAFEFEKALMEEHFNENYVESDKFPKSTFKGSISNTSDVDWNKDGEYKVTVAGDLTIHGVTQKVEESGTIVIKDGVVSANSEFPIAIADYDIEIPKVVIRNIAEKIKIIVKLDLEVLKK